jgi:hypothetical protein
MARQIAVVERSRAEVDRPRRPVTDDRDRRQASQLVGRKEVGDLLEAVAAGIKDEGRFARRQPGKQILQIRNAGIDEDCPRCRGSAVGGRHGPLLYPQGSATTASILCFAASVTPPRFTRRSPRLFIRLRQANRIVENDRPDNEDFSR